MRTLYSAQRSAARELGIRLYMSRGSMDLSVKDGGLPPDSVVQTVDEIMADSIRCIEKYHDDRCGAMHRVALAPCSPFSVSAELLRQSAILARQYHVRLHTHLCETKDEENYMLAREGIRRPACQRDLLRRPCRVAVHVRASVDEYCLHVSFLFFKFSWIRTVSVSLSCDKLCRHLRERGNFTL